MVRYSVGQQVWLLCLLWFHFQVKHISNNYKLNLFSSTHSKYKKVEKHLEASNKDKENIYLNFSSATGWLFPYVIADDVNEYLLDYLKANPTIKTGIVAMDYLGDDLIQAIINTNF